MAKIAGVLLAAGRGGRFGGDKRLARLPDGTPVGVAAARRLVGALPHSVAVLRPGDEILRQLLTAEGLCVTINPDADGGMGTSLARGVAAIEADGWVIALADMPMIRPETMRAVAEALTAGASLAAPDYRGRRGHPIGFARRFRSALTALDGDRGGRDILARHVGELHLVEVDDPGVLVDIDYVTDLPAREP